MKKVKIKYILCFILCSIIGSFVIGNAYAHPRILLSSDKFYIEYGETISQDKNTYLSEDNESEIIKEAKLEINIKNENGKNYPAIGKYKGKVWINDEGQVFNIEVRDTTKPVFDKNALAKSQSNRMQKMSILLTILRQLTYLLLP